MRGRSATRCGGLCFAKSSVGLALSERIARRQSLQPTSFFIATPISASELTT